LERGKASFISGLKQSSKVWEVGTSEYPNPWGKNLC
jgi:hypothetical protein